jgi:hypothetical protein
MEAESQAPWLLEQRPKHDQLIVSLVKGVACSTAEDEPAYRDRYQEDRAAFPLGFPWQITPDLD